MERRGQAGSFGTSSCFVMPEYSDSHVREQMQRIHTMNIVPDLVGDFHPDLDLSISFGRNEIEAGTFVDPELVSDRIHTSLLLD